MLPQKHIEIVDINPKEVRFQFVPYEDLYSELLLSNEIMNNVAFKVFALFFFKFIYLITIN